MGEVQQHFRPEFINRIDDTVVFHPLAKEHMAQIAGYPSSRCSRLAWRSRT